MEGRAIARPNWVPHRYVLCPFSHFNGGPGNCPAKQHIQRHRPDTTAVLQWRAGQLPGQTSTSDDT